MNQGHPRLGMVDAQRLATWRGQLVNGAILLYLAGYLAALVHLLGDNVAYLGAWWEWPAFILADLLLASVWPLYLLVFHWLT